MEKRALVIKTYGDPAMCGAIVDGITPKVIPLNNKELTELKAELAKMKAREEMRHKAEDDRWEEEKQALALQYRVRPHGKIYNALLLGWTFFYLLLAVSCARLWAGIEGRSYTRQRWC